jgi:hypothetical protein
LAFLGRLLPDGALAARWRRVGYATLEREALRQFYPDGVNAEQAFGYLPFVWEFYLHAYRLQPMPDAVRERLAKSIEFVRNVMDASGYVPQVGDEDDGTVVPLWSAAADRHRVVGRALAQVLGCEPPPAYSDADDALAQWLMGETPPAGSRLIESRLYPDGGYAVLHSARWQALFDAGPLGLGSLAAHGHADALAIWASLDGKRLLIDAGTYAYHEDPAWRDHFRSTPAHNTLTLDGKNQSEIQGPFLWGRKARSRFVAHDLREGWVEGETEAYLPDTITRRVQLTGDALTVRDRVRRDATGAVQWYWHFHPDWQVEQASEGVWRITDGVRVCTLQLTRLTGYTARLYRARRGDQARLVLAPLRAQGSLHDAAGGGEATARRHRGSRRCVGVSGGIAACFELRGQSSQLPACERVHKRLLGTCLTRAVQTWLFGLSGTILLTEQSVEVEHGNELSQGRAVRVALAQQLVRASGARDSVAVSIASGDAGRLDAVSWLSGRGCISPFRGRPCGAMWRRSPPP